MKLKIFYLTQAVDEISEEKKAHTKTAPVDAVKNVMGKINGVN